MFALTYRINALLHLIQRDSKDFARLNVLKTVTSKWEHHAGWL